MSSTLLIVEKPTEAYNKLAEFWPKNWKDFLRATEHLRDQPTDVEVLAENVFWFPPSADEQLLAWTRAKAHQFGHPTRRLGLPDLPDWGRYDPNRESV